MCALLTIHPASHFSLTQKLLPQPQSDPWKTTAIKVGLLISTLGILLLGTFLYELFLYATTSSQLKATSQSSNAPSLTAQQASPQVLAPTILQPTLSINTADIPPKAPIIENTCQNTTLIGRIEPQTKGSMANIQNISSWMPNGMDSTSSSEHRKIQVRPAPGLASRCWTWLKKHPVLPIVIGILAIGGLAGLYVKQMQPQPLQTNPYSICYGNMEFNADLTHLCREQLRNHDGFDYSMVLSDAGPIPSINAMYTSGETGCFLKLSEAGDKYFSLPMDPVKRILHCPLNLIKEKFRHCIHDISTRDSNEPYFTFILKVNPFSRVDPRTVAQIHMVR